MSEKPWTGIAGKARSGSPAGHLNDEFLGLLQSWIDDAVSAAMPQMGTVIGQDGGTVKVRLDDEDVDREVGFPAAKGTAYQQNDRVWTHQTKGGSRAVLGRVDGSQDQRAVDSAQLYGDAVKHVHINPGAVERSNIGGQAVAWDELDNVVVSRIQDAATTSQLNNVSDKADDAKSSASDANRAANDADKTANDAKNAASAVKSALDKLEKRVDKLEKSKDKKA